VYETLNVVLTSDKGNQPTGAIVDLFNDMVNCADEPTGATTKSLCNKLLMGTVKQDIPAVEASYELSSLPLYRSSHTFQNISVSGFRQIEKESNGMAITKNTAQLQLTGYLCKHILTHIFQLQ
jgi:hypothetical protein